MSHNNLKYNNVIQYIIMLCYKSIDKADKRKIVKVHYSNVEVLKILNSILKFNELLTFYFRY